MVSVIVLMRMLACDAPTTVLPVLLEAAAAIPQCNAYLRHPDVYGFCLYKQVARLASIEEMEQTCRLAGSWEAGCRHSWIAAHTDSVYGYSVEALMAGCAEKADCIFELVDARPLDDFLAQSARCDRVAGVYARDCVGHAAQRWIRSGPDAAELLRVTGAPTVHPDRVGYWLGVGTQCFGIALCEGDAAVVRHCRGAVENFRRNPHRCPPREQRERAPIAPGARP